MIHGDEKKNFNLLASMMSGNQAGIFEQGSLVCGNDDSSDSPVIRG